VPGSEGPAPVGDELAAARRSHRARRLELVVTALELRSLEDRRAGRPVPPALLAALREYRAELRELDADVAA
jgi:hypothetical protein